MNFYRPYHLAVMPADVIYPGHLPIPEDSS